MRYISTCEPVPVLELVDTAAYSKKECDFFSCARGYQSVLFPLYLNFHGHGTGRAFVRADISPFSFLFISVSAYASAAHGGTGLPWLSAEWVVRGVRRYGARFIGWAGRKGTL
jgi:hypothetical protein